MCLHVVQQLLEIITNSQRESLRKNDAMYIHVQIFRYVKLSGWIFSRALEQFWQSAILGTTGDA